MNTKFLLPLLILFFITSCSIYTQSDIDLYEKKINELETQSKRKELSFKNEKNIFETEIKKKDEEIERLNKIINSEIQEDVKATNDESVNKNTDSVVEIDSKYKYNKNANVQETSQAKPEPPKKNNVTKNIALKNGESSKKIYDAGIKLFLSRRYLDAIELFNRFLKESPPYDLIDNGHFWLGECFYSLRQYNKAILQYQIVENKYSEGNKFYPALLKLGITYLKTGKKHEGIQYLKRLVATDSGSFNDTSVLRAKKILKKYKNDI